MSSQIQSHHPPSEFDSGNSDSITSTPRSEHHHHHHRSYNHDSTALQSQPRVRYMCSFGGKILLRPHDNQLRYVGGDTRIVALNRRTTFAALLSKLSKLAGNNSNINIKYQLPNEDLDALITVTTDEDVENMMEEYDRLSQNHKSTRLRLFLFVNDSDSRASTISSILDGSVKREQWFVDALNGGVGSGSGTGLERGRSEASSIVSEVPDYLFGLDTPDERESKFVKNNSNSGHDLPFCSTSSSMAPPSMSVIPDLPPVKTKLDNPVEVPESNETPVEKQTGYQTNPVWHYPAAPMQTIPVYYVPGPVQPGNIPVQSITMRAPYVQPFPVHPNHLSFGFQPVSSVGQVYSGVRPVMGMDARIVPEGMGQPMYYGLRSAGVNPGYGGEKKSMDPEQTEMWVGSPKHL